MKIDIKFLKSLIKGKDKKYIFELYKIYDLCMKITDNNLSKGKKLLKEKEDRVYTVNGGVLSEDDRIIFEIKRIFEKVKDVYDDVEKYTFMTSLRTINDNLSYKNNVYDKKEEQLEEKYLSIKRSISILQAKLGIPISFFYAASTAFKDIYQIEYINDLSNDVYFVENNIKIINYNEKIDNIDDNKYVYKNIVKNKKIDKGLY